MKYIMRKALCYFLVVCLMVTYTPSVFATSFTARSGESYFDFEASEYEVNENDGELKIKIVRHGDGTDEANVSFKVADFLSDYGKDYVVLDSNGHKLEKVYGVKPDLEDLVLVDEDAEPEEPSSLDENDEQAIEPEGEQAGEPEVSDEQNAGDEPELADEPADEPVDEPANEQANELADEDAVDAKDLGNESELANEPAGEPEVLDEQNAGDEPELAGEPADEPAGEQANELADEDAVDAQDLGNESELANEPADEPGFASGAKLRKSTGSPLLDARNQLLNIEDDNEQLEDAMKTTLDDLYNYFITAEGAEGMVHFGKGDRQKTITVKINDNKKSEANKIFMIALIGTDKDTTSVAPNATTYVTIIDNEKVGEAVFSLEDDGIALTNDHRSDYVTITRSGATQYFDTVYLSTVMQTADASAYKNIDDKKIAFVPGETEKKVEVEAYDFSEDAFFGVRLFSEDDAKIDNHYIDIDIVSNDSKNGLMALSQNQSLDALYTQENNSMTPLMAPLKAGSLLGASSPVTIGSASYRYSNPGIQLYDTWDPDVNGTGYARWNNQFYVQQDTKNAHSMYVTRQPQNFTGVRSISFNIRVYNNDNRSADYYKTFLETDTDKTFDGHVDQYVIYGNTWWTGDESNWNSEKQLQLKNTGPSAYLKFATQPYATGWSNPHATLDWLQYNYSHFTFNPMNSQQNFNRKVYDFTQGTPRIYDTYFDGETNKGYNPGKVIVKINGDQKVSGFYGDANRYVTIEAENAKLNEERGIRLKSIKFAKSSNLNSNYYEVSGYNGRIDLYINKNFIRDLKDCGVISNVHEDATINIYPIFERVYTTVDFENTDVTPELSGKSSYNLLYDDEHKGSYIANILEAYSANKNNNDTKLEKKTYKSSKDTNSQYYSMRIPKNSVLRLQVVPISTRVPKGVMYSYGNEKKTTYLKEGDKICSETNSSGEVIAQTDYTKAEIVVPGESITIKPVTGQQTFDVVYFPTEWENRPDELKTKGLENVIVTEADLQKLVDMEQVIVDGSDSEGKYSFEEPYIGMKWSLRANPPAGYYTQWANMTGDLDNSGYIDENEFNARRSSSKTMPDHVYGNVLSGTLDQDNFRLAYYFIPKSNTRVSKKTGVVTRSADNFYELANHIDTYRPNVPVAGAYVNLAGNEQMTDAEGKYSINCGDLPPVGDVATTIKADGYFHTTISKLERFTETNLPALTKFEPKALSASYEKTKDAIKGTNIIVNDEMLTIEATVIGNGTLYATGAEFRVYDAADTLKVDCQSQENEEKYTIGGYSEGNKYTATLTFNPKQDMSTGYTLKVRFKDLNNEYTNWIDLGYRFVGKLDLGQFVFPLLGNDSLGGVLDVATEIHDIIGNPLGGPDFGVLDNFETVSYEHTPSNINKKDAANYTRLMTDYTFGWSKDFEGTKELGKKDDDNGEEGDDKESGNKEENGEKDGSGDNKSDDSSEKPEKSKEKKSTEENAKDTLDKVKESNAGKETDENSEYKTSSEFSWKITPKIGFNLTISNGGAGRDATKYYFEDLVFFVTVNMSAEVTQTIQTPIGVSIMVGVGLGGEITGIYHMFVDYKESYETEDAVVYDAENFGIFKKFNNSVRREGYLFINPYIFVKLGIKYGIIYVSGKANFSFDMDFKFDEIGTYAYGDFKIDLEWGIQLFGFDVYNNSQQVLKQKIFNTPGQDGHIEFDTTPGSQKNMLRSTFRSAIVDAFDVGDDPIAVDRLVSTAYLENRSEWLGDRIPLLAPKAKGAVNNPTTETTLRTGTTINPQSQMISIGDDKLLLVYIDNDITRPYTVNQRALYYTIYDGGLWSEPELVDNDGTLDDFPTLCEVGDDKIFVGFSSAEQVFDEDATLTNALQNMNIKGAFFDKTSGTMGVPTAITKTTQEDYATDILPYAAYDETSQKMILYYTKTEYGDLSKTNYAEFSEAVSVNAYMFYDETYDKWSSGNDYTPEEIANIEESIINVSQLTPEQIEVEIGKYKENWYGQRFLDLRISDVNTDDMPVVVDSNAISYNSLALFAWTIDWDKNLDTVNDRDVFMQIYDFDEDIFTYIIKITDEQGSYLAPKFARSNNETYLFFGDVASDGEGGKIKYINVSQPIREGGFKLNTSNNHNYYELVTTKDEFEWESENSELTNTGETIDIRITPQVASSCENCGDYDVIVSETGEMYLLWTQVVENTRQIVASVYMEGDSDEEPSAPISQASSINWGEPIAITNAGNDEFYSGISADVIDGNIIVAGAKGKYEDPADTSFVWVKHVPFSELVVDSLSVDREYPLAGSTVTLTAKVKNIGLLTSKANEAQPIEVTFADGSGEVLGKGSYKKSVAGGSIADVIFQYALPSDFSNIEFGAYLDDPDEKATLTLTATSKLQFGETTTYGYHVDNKTSIEFRFISEFENVGNKNAEDINIKAYVGRKLAGEMTQPSVPAGDMALVEIPLEVQDSSFEIGENGIGTAPVYVIAFIGDDEVASYEGSIKKGFDEKAIALLDTIPKRKLMAQKTFRLEKGEELALMPSDFGLSDVDFAIVPTGIANTNIVDTNYDRHLIGIENGTTQVTALVVPNEDRIEIDRYGNTLVYDWESVIPEDKIARITANIKVGKSSSSSGGTTAPSEGDNSENTDNPIISTTTTTDAQGNTIETSKYQDGSTSVTKTNTDGSQNITNTNKEGVVATQDIAPNGKVGQTEIVVPNTAKSDDVSVPLTVLASDVQDEIEISIKNEAENTKNYSIPLENVNTGIVAVIVNEDGSEQILRDTFFEDGSLVVEIEGDAVIKLCDNSKTFNDVSENAWFADAVKYVAARDIFSGVGAGIFAPNEGMTRGMLAKVLHNLENNPESINENLFSDTEGHWAAESVQWAAENEIVTGYEDGTFAVDQEITREQLVTMLYRYANASAGEGTLEGFEDQGDVSEYALEAMKWAIENGIITGTSSYILDPKGKATRGQVAMIIMRFLALK